MLQGHGDDIHSLDTKNLLNFSSNVPAINNDWIQDIIVNNVHKISNYPEPDNRKLRKFFAEKEGIKEEEVIFTNGATEAIYLVASSYPGAISCIRIPTFAEYRDACDNFGHNIISVNDLSNISGNSDLIWICNPNNPTGETISREELLEIIDNQKSKIFVLDLSYKDLTNIEPISYHDIIGRENVIGIFSLTKSYRIPGLRVGYIISNRNLTECLLKKKMPWAVNALAESVAFAIIGRNEKPDILHLLDETKRVAKNMSSFGIKVLPTQTNFLLCETPWGDAAGLKKFLIENYNLLIRDASNFEGLGKGHFRASIQDNGSNEILIKGLKQWASLFKN